MTKQYPIKLDAEVYDHIEKFNLTIGHYKGKRWPYPALIVVHPDGKMEDLAEVVVHVMCEGLLEGVTYGNH